MTTITIDNPKIENKYSSSEIQMKFLQFLREEIGEENVELYEISVVDAPSEVQDAYKNIDDQDFIEA